MRIALVPSAFHPSFGGVEEHCRQLAHALRGLGHHVIIVTNRWPRDLPSYEEIEGLPVHRLAFRTPDVGVKSKLTYGLTGRAVKRRLDRILCENGIDIVHVHCVSSNGFYAGASARSLGLPLVVTAHGELTMDAQRLFERSAFARQTLRRVLADARAVTACSRYTLQELEDFWGRPFGNRGQVIYNGIRMDDIETAVPYQHSRPYFLAIGRHVAQKGFDVLLRALARAGDLGMDLVLAGDGPEKRQLQELVVSLGLEQSVHFPGRVDHATAMGLFRGCEFFVLPSRHEPFGIVNLEAMAAGKAVIASRTGGVPEIVEDGQVGLLVPPEDESGLSAALARLAADRGLRDRLGDAGRRDAAGFSWANIADQYLEVYRGVSAAPGKQVVTSAS
jgi:glycogen(starch) synthase